MTPHPWAGGPVRPGPVWADPPQHRPPRAITQICGSPEGLFALCNDGTVWQLLGGMWLPEPGIPQRQLVEEEA